MGAYTVIVPDALTLQRLCGTNDSNLKLIENFLNCQVFACGNELSIENGSGETQSQFSYIIDRFLDEVADGSAETTDKDLILSILNQQPERNSSAKEHSLFSKYSISVPGGIRKVYPRTSGQSELVRKMRTDDLVFALGPAGSGKTFLAVAEALRLLLSHEKKNIILTRPVVEAGESLGYLPGALEDKINPYIRPLYDAMNSIIPRDAVKRMVENGTIEIAPLAYMRGRTLNNSVIILDEAQNCTCEQMKMFLTRLGENSKMFITGDPSQVDLPKKINSGLNDAVRILRETEGISVMELTSQDVVRNELVKKIIRAYENEERNFK
ncbi:MAG: PhoH family protein [Spirochaetales bacterium]|nr:PhoH family protein [Spirochaetia bacterium]MDD7014560.1 PhoH family protein [Spirochaetales bacterium]